MELTMSRVLRMLMLAMIPLALLSCGKKPLQSESLLDTPQTHTDQGLRLIDRDELDAAEREIQRALAMDPKYFLAHSALGLLRAERGQGEEALESADKAVKIADNRWQGYTFRGRILSMVQPKDWFEDATDDFERALKLQGKKDEIYFWKGMAQKLNFDFAGAVATFGQVIAQRGDFGGRADTQLELCNKIVRARPGTRVTSKIALVDEIDRADLAVLLVEELKLPEILNKMRPQVQDNSFRAPSARTQTADAPQVPADIADHWAKTWIQDVLDAGGMELFPDGEFHPEAEMTRGEYAMLIVTILIEVSGDQGLATRHFGEASMFPDVPSSHPQYNAIAVCTSRGIMKADLSTGEFGLLKPLSGADALLIIRQFQNVLRQTF